MAMATELRISAEQAEAILTKGTPYGIGGNIIRVRGLAEAPKEGQQLYAGREAVYKPVPLVPDRTEFACHRPIEPFQVPPTPINDLMGGLDWRKLSPDGRTIKTIQPVVEMTYDMQGEIALPFVEIDFDKNKLEALIKKQQPKR